MLIKHNINIIDTVFLQEVDEETILLDTSTEEYFSLNEVGNIFYHMLKEEPSFEKSSKILAEHFQRPLEEIQKDLLAFAKALEAKGLATIS